MRGYEPSTYGDAFVDVYDEWYDDVSDVDATVEAVTSWAEGGRVLELGVGTGRIALPLARRGVRIEGIDTSPAMLAALAAKPGGEAVPAVLGDMADDLPAGPFAVVFVAYNTFFANLTEQAQRSCIAAVAARLAPGGRFAIEAFVPHDDVEERSDVSVRSMAADRVVLSVSRHHPETQRAEGQFVEFTQEGGVRLRPWSIRWATPAQLDDFAAEAGLVLERRSADWAGAPFGPDSGQHVSVWRRP